MSDERDDVVHLAIERGEPVPESAEARRIADEHAALAQALRALDEPEDAGEDDEWMDATIAAATATSDSDEPEASSTRWRSWAVVASLAAAAVLVLVLRPGPGIDDGPGPEAPLRIELQITDPGGMRGEQAAVGSRLTATVSSDSDVALRWYVGNELLAACGRSTSSCRSTDDGLVLTISAERPGRYQALVMRGSAVPPSTGSLAADARAARDAGAQVRFSDTIDVQ